MRRIILSFAFVVALGIAAAGIIWFANVVTAPAHAATLLPGCSTTDSEVWQNNDYVITQTTTCTGLQPAPTVQPAP